MSGIRTRLKRQFRESRRHHIYCCGYKLPRNTWCHVWMVLDGERFHIGKVFTDRPDPRVEVGRG